jgi:hypothetical protein
LIDKIHHDEANTSFTTLENVMNLQQIDLEQEGLSKRSLTFKRHAQRNTV